jgi:hypothetical protein
VSTESEEEPEKETNEEEGRKNRYTRRREAEAQRLRDENIQLNERVKVLSEVGKFKEEVGDSDAYSKLDAILGNNEPGKLAATNILKEVIKDLTEKNKQELRQELDSRSEQESEAQKEADDEVDSFLDTAEDEGLDIEDENTRKGLITLMERMSSKYNDGNIKEFADPEAVIETYKELQKRSGSSKARELASRSMTRSGESQPSTLPQNAIDRFMTENGLTGNW